MDANPCQIYTWQLLSPHSVISLARFKIPDLIYSIFCLVSCAFGGYCSKKESIILVS